LVKFLSTRVFPSLEAFETFVAEGELEKLLEGWEFDNLSSLD